MYANACENRNGNEKILNIPAKRTHTITELRAKVENYYVLMAK